MTHKDLILCNGQSCLPILLLFNFTVRQCIEFVINFSLTWNSINIAIILCMLIFTTTRFIFGFFDGNNSTDDTEQGKTQKYDIHWNLMRCHFFYRGDKIRWCSFLIYSWFSSLMILELMDSLCLGRFDVDNSWKLREEILRQSSLCGIKRIKFITCDTVIVIYCVMVLSVWNRLKRIDMRYFRQYRTMYLYYDLCVDQMGIKEVFVFIGMFLLTFALCETWLQDMIIKKTVLPFTVIIVLIINFLMR